MAYRLSTLLGLKLQDDDEFASIVPTANNFETVDAAIAADRTRLSAIETPSVTAATTLTTIASGDTHGTILGKVKKLITDFLAHVGAGGTAHAAASTSTAGFMSAADKEKLNGIDTGANKYTHPTATAKSSGLYKITVDGTGHVSAATAVQKSDITGLGIPGSSTSYSNATQSAAGLMSAADKTKLDGIEHISNINQTTYRGWVDQHEARATKAIRVGDVIIGYGEFNGELAAGSSSVHFGWKPIDGWTPAFAIPYAMDESITVSNLGTGSGLVSADLTNNGTTTKNGSDVKFVVLLVKDN